MVGRLSNWPGLRIIRQDGLLTCVIDPDDERTEEEQRHLEQARFEISRYLGWTREIQPEHLRLVEPEP